ncbi:hypothetical protein B0A48_16081 [Cryoendolithus antarcticus]|uniref:Sec20 C-terminal domain-containing protein n=1 Tax=Cryoendolithus antarcticus TaxID=1507870 RepID=A0A1V8SFK3_9PEZI|nr:hypothetical protein B0A48_16081 [Cryoendolithus antarcticus]
MASTLQSHLQSLTSTLTQTTTLITRLQALSFQPGSESLSENPNSVRLELAQDIHDSLAQLDEDLELLRLELEDLTDSHGTGSAGFSGLAGRTRSGSVRRGSKAGEIERLQASVLKLGEDLKSARAGFRRAQIVAKKNAEAAKVQERELVFAELRKETAARDSSGASTPRESLFAHRSKGKAGRSGQQVRSGDDLLVTTSSDLTTSLRRTHALLETEVGRSHFATETLEQSTAALAELGDKYTDLGSVLGKSRELLSTLVRSQKSDTWYLETAFYLLCATLVWLIFRRLLYGPFIRLPLFFYRVGIFLLNWVLLKPLLLFCTVTGIITTTPYDPTSSALAYQSTTTRRPLIIQPSATEGVRQFIPGMADKLKSVGVPAGAGGGGAKRDKSGELSGKVSEEIGKMAAGEKEEVKRGDGTVLRERREDEKPNPRKKGFVDESSEEGKVRDEL